MKARYFVNKAKRLEQRLSDLQFDIYSFSTELENVYADGFAQLATESGFELDVARNKMNEVWTGIEAAFCNKITKNDLCKRKRK